MKPRGTQRGASTPIHAYPEASRSHLPSARMPFTIGQTLRGGKASYKLLQSLKGHSVFKASIVVPNETQQSEAKL